MKVWCDHDTQESLDEDDDSPGGLDDDHDAPEILDYDLELPMVLTMITIHWRVFTEMTKVPMDLMSITMLLRAWTMTTELPMVLTMTIIYWSVLTKVTTVPMDLITTLQVQRGLGHVPLEKTRFSLTPLEMTRI